MRNVIVTGMSGAGKSTVIRQLEDMGYFCVDNIPVELIPTLTKTFINNESIDKVALGIDNASFLFNTPVNSPFLGKRMISPGLLKSSKKSLILCIHKENFKTVSILLKRIKYPV